MRIKFAVMVVTVAMGVAALVIMLILILERPDTLCQFDDRSLRSAGFGQSLHETLQLHSVDKNDIGGSHGSRIGGAWFVDMRIAIRTDERFQIDPVATDITGEVFDDRETRHHFQRLRSRGKDSDRC